MARRERIFTGCGTILAAFLAFAAPAAAQVPEVEKGESVSGAFLAGRYADSVNDFHAASEYYREALTRDPQGAQLLEQSFQLALASGTLDEAFKLAQRLLAQEPNHRVARLATGVKLLKLGRYAEAKAQFLPTGRAANTDFVGVALAAWAAQGAGDTSVALDALDKIGGAEWIELYKAFHSGLIAAMANRQEDATRRLSKAYEQDPNLLRLVDAYARHQARAGRKADALRTLDAYQKTAPNHPLVVLTRAAVSAQGRPAPLVATAAQGAAELLYGVGSALGRQERESKEVGAIYLNLSLHLDESHPFTFYALADLYNSLGQRERANAMFERIPRESPVWRTAQTQIATNLDALNKTDEALQKLELLLEADYSNSDAAITLGDVLRGRERFAEAAKAYGRAIDAIQGKPDERHWSLYFFRGMSHERAKNWPAAEVDFKKSLELSPDQALTLNYLGYSWVDQNVNLDKGVEMIRKAVELKPEDGFIVDSLGWAYYRLGRFEEAVEELERAVELQSQDATINDHLGDAYWRVGRVIEAKFQWERALGFKPEPDEKIKIEQKIKDGLSDKPAAGKL